MPKVECDLGDCKHNRYGECVADVISLWSDHVCDGGCDQGWVMREYIVTEHPDFPYEEPKPQELIRCKYCKNHEHWFGDTYRCADSGTVVSEDDTCPYWHEKDGDADGHR